ncbi:hypothetical protein [Roseimaritima ulvae]|uniref:hypothetical protein n=1 Tax=Roseimaritima ulvae TaxID=980254 RepID=UPI0012FB4BB7|nr:hypothetical protein [Roseimaritima ulvae]
MTRPANPAGDGSAVVVEMVADFCSFHRAGDGQQAGQLGCVQRLANFQQFEGVI